MAGDGTPNPFWSDEVQRQFMEGAEELRERPPDLANYEQRQSEHERQELHEPPYDLEAAPSGSLGIDPGTREMIQDSANEADSELRGRLQAAEDRSIRAARLEPRLDRSPGRSSRGRESEMSVKTATSKREASEPELMAEQTTTLVAQLAEAQQAVATQPPPSADLLLQQLGSLVQQALHEQVTPTLQQMMLQQARMESRLEVIETTSRAASQDGDMLAERTRLLELTGMSGMPDEPPIRPEVTTPVHSLSARVKPVQVESRPPGLWAEPTPKGADDGLFGGRSEGTRPSEPAQPNQGTVRVGESLYAWHVTAGGLQLLPVGPEMTHTVGVREATHVPTPERKEKKEEISPEAPSVFSRRASSPFQRYEARSEPGEPHVGAYFESRGLRPNASDPLPDPAGVPVRYGPKPLGYPASSVWKQSPESASPSPPKHHVRYEGTNLAAGQALASSAVGYGPQRTVTPVKPRITYPISPGGTEIKPPPARSPKRAARTSPSPTRPKHPMTPTAPSSPAETDLQRLAAVLEGAFKSGRGGDTRVEDVKTVPDLPKLENKDHEKELTPLIAGDWLALIGPSLRDLSSHANEWWQEVQNAAHTYYSKWLESSPIDRLLMKPERPGRFDSGPFARVKQRAISLLLKAVPPQVREDVVAMRKMSTIEIIGAILTTYQPGGLRERSALLKFLTTPESSKSVSEALKGVRRWTRWRNRAAELSVSIPDATSLIAGLDVLTGSVFLQYPEVHFRLQTFRHQHSVDHIPTQEKAISLGQIIQAELQILENAAPRKKPKLAKVLDAEGQTGDSTGTWGKGGKADSKGGSKGWGKKGGKDSKGNESSRDAKSCYHWMSKHGCKLGKDCKFYHDKQALGTAADVGNRCFVCSGLGHRAAECPSIQQSLNIGSSSSEGSTTKGPKGGGKATPKAQAAKRIEEEKPLDNEQAKLISAATSLLEQMQAKALDGNLELNRMSQDTDRTGLIDSGASACLRQARGSEPEGLLKRTVDLAQGKVDLFVTSCGTLISTEPIEAIVALGPLIKLGCRLQWGDGECTLWHPTHGRISLQAKHWLWI